MNAIATTRPVAEQSLSTAAAVGHRPSRTGRPLKDGKNPIDVHVGSRVRLRRSLMGMSQEALGDALGLTFQQVQKYEKGTNRICASTLFRLSVILDVPVSFFFDAMPDEGQTPMVSAVAGANSDQLHSTETLPLLRAFQRIKDREVRQKVSALVKTLAAAAGDA